MDVDRFKSINDSHGHEAGDKVLIALTQALQQGLRDYD
jgi:diguanylate cyclase (GGDEF)-like protein